MSEVSTLYPATAYDPVTGLHRDAIRWMLFALVDAAAKGEDLQHWVNGMTALGVAYGRAGGVPEDLECFNRPGVEWTSLKPAPLSLHVDRLLARIAAAVGTVQRADATGRDAAVLAALAADKAAALIAEVLRGYERTDPRAAPLLMALSAVMDAAEAAAMLAVPRPSAQ